MDNEAGAGREPKRGIGGWLLVYVVLTALSITFTLLRSLMDLSSALHPVLWRGELVAALLTFAWYLTYAAALYRLVRLKPGAVSRIKVMIALTPVFSACLPFAYSAVLVLSVPGASLLQVLRAVYSSCTLWGHFFGMAVMAFVWHRYFSVSERVRNTWPETRA